MGLSPTLSWWFASIVIVSPLGGVRSLNIAMGGVCLPGFGHCPPTAMESAGRAATRGVKAGSARPRSQAQVLEIHAADWSPQGRGGQIADSGPQAAAKVSQGGLA